jgi:hypothetical protein
MPEITSKDIIKMARELKGIWEPMKSVPIKLHELNRWQLLRLFWFHFKYNGRIK